MNEPSHSRGSAAASADVESMRTADAAMEMIEKDFIITRVTFPK